MPGKGQKMWKEEGQAGFTLIEVMIALVIFIIGIIGCYQMQISSTASNITAANVATSASWGSYRAEDLINREFTALNTDLALQNVNGNTDGTQNIDDTNGPGDTPDGVLYIRADGSTGSVAGASDLYTVYWNVADDIPLAPVKKIRIIVVKNGGLNSGILYTQDCYKLGPI